MNITTEKWTGVPLQFAQALNEQGLTQFPDVLSMHHKPGVAMLVEPMINAPYVVHFDSPTSATVTIFNPDSSMDEDEQDTLRCCKAAAEFYLAIPPLRKTA